MFCTHMMEVWKTIEPIAELMRSRDSKISCYPTVATAMAFDALPTCSLFTVCRGIAGKLDCFAATVLMERCKEPEPYNSHM